MRSGLQRLVINVALADIYLDAFNSIYLFIKY
jgi:hypothetical protein